MAARAAPAPCVSAVRTCCDSVSITVESRSMPLARALAANRRRPCPGSTASGATRYAPPAPRRGRGATPDGAPRLRQGRLQRFLHLRGTREPTRRVGGERARDHAPEGRRDAATQLLHRAHLTARVCAP